MAVMPLWHMVSGLHAPALLTLDTARRASEVLLAVAIIQQASEHVVTRPRDRPWALAQLTLGLALAVGVAPAWVEGVLLLVNAETLEHWGGPYNGGSDRMRLLLLLCLFASHLVDARVALGYLAVQVVLSYTLAGYVKLVSPQWRRGEALADVFDWSVYPVSGAVRRLARARRTVRTLSWLTIAFEILFPLCLLHPVLLVAALSVAFVFHLFNAAAFGLNRFVWAWLAAYPCVLWFEDEVLAGGALLRSLLHGGH
mgnify:CR=1 FL=1